MAAVGDETTRLVVLRGNSGSGKSTTAKEIRQRIGVGVAWVEQDYLRRTLLLEHPHPGTPNIGLIDQTTRYALDHGYHVVLEGGLYSPVYGEMLRELVADHVGPTGVYYFQLEFEETLRRHHTKPQTTVSPDRIRSWYQPRDVLGVPGEQLIEADSTVDQTVDRIIKDLSWTTGGTIPSAIEPGN